MPVRKPDTARGETAKRARDAAEGPQGTGWKPDAVRARPRREGLEPSGQNPEKSNTAKIAPGLDVSERRGDSHDSH